MLDGFVNRMRIVILILLMTFAPCAAAGQEHAKLREEMPFKLSSGESGYAKIEIKRRRLRRGELYAVKYTFYNTGAAYRVYNCFFNRLIPLPGQLAIYDSNKEYVGDLIRFEGGSQRRVEDDDWLLLYGGSHVGANIGFRAGYVPQTKYWNMENLLPAGRYFIQLILYKAFLSPNPYRLIGEKLDFYKTFDRSEVIRSNVIEVEMVD